MARCGSVWNWYCRKGDAASFFLPKADLCLNPQNFKDMHHKNNTKKYSNLHMVRISHFIFERKISLKWNETSRDFNFAVKTQCKFYIFVVMSFGKQKIKICNLVFFIVEDKGNNKSTSNWHCRFVLLCATIDEQRMQLKAAKWGAKQ